MNWNITFLSTLNFLLKTIRLRANRRNIGVQQLPALLDVTCCVRLHTLLHVVAQSLKRTGPIFQPTTPNISFVPWSPKRSATMLDPFAQLFQHCWGHARSLRMVYKDLWVVSFPRCTAGPNIVGSCCIRLHTAVHTTANTHDKKNQPAKKRYTILSMYEFQSQTSVRSYRGDPDPPDPPPASAYDLSGWLISPSWNAGDQRTQDC